MYIWELEEAEEKLSHVMKLCDTEPQIIFIRGEQKVIMLSIADYKQLLANEEDLVTFFRNSPLMSLSVPLDRDQSLGRDIEL